ncbi:hypothetical protein [uncultured Parabacteroides sp.]|uniref:hypothetical protein n=1 Tax=uncultured Parabacteroides sp. TaxID=512312 RepID=UPI002658ACBC|nr:hypothetical protein [uncultured Parabacteroides sp.]
MITTCFPIGKERVNNLCQTFDASAQKVQEEKTIYTYHQNEELSSKETGSLQIEERSLLQSRYSDPDDILVQIGFVPKVIEIPDEMFRKAIEDSLEGGHLDSPGQMGRNGLVSCSTEHRIDKDGT